MNQRTPDLGDGEAPPPFVYQSAPYPRELQRLVGELRYKPGWSFWLADKERDPGCAGLTLFIQVYAPNTDAPEEMKRLIHLFPVPPATYNRQSWLRWLLDCLLKVEQHEACEFLRVKGEQPFRPTHGPGNDPYTIRELATDEQRRTTYRGELLPAAE